MTSAKATSDHSLCLKFDDGTHGEVDLAAELKGPIFEELLDPEPVQTGLRRSRASHRLLAEWCRLRSEVSEKPGLGEATRLTPQN